MHNKSMPRMLPFKYKDGISEPIDRVNPRTLSNLIGEVSGSIPENKFNISVALTFWGQFIDHDLDLINEG